MEAQKEILNTISKLEGAILSLAQWSRGKILALGVKSCDASDPGFEPLQGPFFSFLAVSLLCAVYFFLR